MISHAVKIVWLILLITISGCSQREDNYISDISIWESKADSSVLLKRIDRIAFNDSALNDLPLIIFDTNNTVQTIEGFGAALTGSSAFVMNRYLDSGQRLNLMRDLFTPQGAGIDYLRITIGASDFSLKDFTYNDVIDDTLMHHFSLDPEKTDLLPVLKEILMVNPAIKIMASPWSAPGWMKTNGSMIGGQLKPEYHRAYARYLVHYIQHMQQEGISIDAISIQNEPLHGSAAYPCMDMYAPDQRDFIRDHLGPLFKQEGIRTKIILYDHNWDRPLYADTILRDPTAASYAAGTAFHAYGGDVSAMSELKQLHPEKDIYFTEISGGRWAPVFGDNMKWYAKNIIIGTMRNYSRNALFWNLALDENDGPQNRGCGDCRGVVTVTSTGAIHKNVEYYVLAHAGKFIRQGARYCATNMLADKEILNAAFINPDGSRVLLILNSGSGAKTIAVQEGDKFAKIELEPNAFYSMIWD